MFSNWPVSVKCSRVNLKKLACATPHPVIIGLSVMKNKLAANRWSLYKTRAIVLRMGKGKGKKNCHGKMCQNLMFCRVKSLFSVFCSQLEIQPCSSLFGAQTSNRVFFDTEPQMNKDWS